MSCQVETRAKMEGGSASEVQRKSTPPKKISCDLTTQAFGEVVMFDTFVDKTLFIKAFLEEDDKVTVALAPRRFGKSTNMSMVKEFVTGNKKLFEDNQLKIWKEERCFFDKYCKENPVIYVDFKSVRGITEVELLKSLKKLIIGAFKQHRYLTKKVHGKYSWADMKLEDVSPIETFEKYLKTPESLDRCDVINGLNYLCECLHVYHDKLVYVLIDEYDSPIMQVILETGSENDLLNETIDVIGRLMSKLFKDNEHIKKGLINACVRMAEVLSGDANNIQYYEFLRKPRFSPYFGFTDAEVNSLLEKEEFVPFKDDQVKEWYNGYRLMHTKDYVIYSCYSVLKYLKNSNKMNEPQFKNYWVDSGSITYLKELFGDDEIREKVEYLINGEEIVINTISKFAKEDIFALQEMAHCYNLDDTNNLQVDLFLQFLTENGYLNVVSAGIETSTIRIPNQEISMLLQKKCYNKDLFKKKYQLSRKNIHRYETALESLLEQRDKPAFIMYANATSELFDGAIMPECEDEFHCILFALAYDNKMFTVRSGLSVHRKKSRGRPPRLDLLVILKEAGLIVEFKFEHKTSVEALSQIRMQRHKTAFDNYKNVTEKILMGVHMTKDKKVSLTYSINDLPDETVISE